MNRFDVIIIGAGLFGSLITRNLRRCGAAVLAIDDQREGSGSRPAACLMRPSWFSDLGKAVYEPALRTLDTLVGVQDIEFKLPVGSTIVHWCDPRKILLTPDEYRLGTVKAISKESLRDYQVEYWVSAPGIRSFGQFAYASVVIVAGGIWSSALCPYDHFNVVGQAGVAWLFSGSEIIKPFIKVWAPYKQIVGFNRGDGLWVGDGTTVKYWSDAYEYKSRLRCCAELGRHEGRYVDVATPRRLFGYRPYVKGAKPCFLKQINPGFWVATGGAKNGTIAAGWAADQIVRALI